MQEGLGAVVAVEALVFEDQPVGRVHHHLLQVEDGMEQPTTHTQVWRKRGRREPRK